MESRLTTAEIALIAATREALGAGVGLLVSNRLNEDQRKTAGIALAVVGGLTTIPLVLTVARRKTTGPAELRSVA